MGKASVNDSDMMGKFWLTARKARTRYFFVISMYSPTYQSFKSATAAHTISCVISVKKLTFAVSHLRIYLLICDSRLIFYAAVYVFGGGYGKRCYSYIQSCLTAPM